MPKEKRRRHRRNVTLEFLSSRESLATDAGGHESGYSVIIKETLKLIQESDIMLGQSHPYKNPREVGY